MELAITLDTQAAWPLHRQLYEELRQSILAGRLAPGQRVPSTRALATSLGVSRATVTQSYEQLLSEGYFQAVAGSGTFVGRHLPDDLLRPAAVKAAVRVARTARPAVPLSSYGASLADAESFEPPGHESPINFRHGRPAFDAFPLRQWRRLLLRHCRAGQRAMLDYAQNSLGYEPLREAIAGHLARSRAVVCQADQVIIVSGSQQALDLITRVLVERGETVAMEDPGYLGARRAFLAQGAKLLPVPVDAAGMKVEYLMARPAAKPKLIHVTPSHQFPTGAVLSLPRRLELLAWAAQSGAMIVEDDYDSEYRYGSRPIPALQGLDQSASVIYVGTFSKMMFPALRLGYMVVPQSVARVLARAKWLADRHASMLEQYALADFINEGHLERHLRRMRTLYDRRRQALVRALTLHFGERVEIMGESAGMHLTARLETKLSDEEIMRRAEQAGVGLVSARPYFLKSRWKNEFIFGYASLSERRIQEGVRRLAQALDQASAVNHQQAPG